MDKYKELENRIAALEKTIKDMQNSSTVPTNIDMAFSGRGYIRTQPKTLNSLGTWTIDSYARINQGVLAGLWVPLYTKT